jgi:hypothetical protein
VQVTGGTHPGSVAFSKKRRTTVSAIRSTCVQGLGLRVEGFGLRAEG